MKPSSDNTVQVWIERSAAHVDTRRLEVLLDESEISRANRFLYQKDRMDFIVAHALKRKRIAEKLGIKDPSKLRFAAGPSGKPYLLDADIHFNLSHSHGKSALAISIEAPCAVDIETHRHINQLPLLIQKTMTKHEQNQIKAAPSQLKAFIDRWVLKEAFLKLSGIGLAMPMTSICTASELVSVQDCLGMLRGAALFFKRGKDYSLAASGSNAIGFELVKAPESDLLEAAA